MNKITSINNLTVPDKKGFHLNIRSKMLIFFGSKILVMLALFILADIYGIPFTDFRGVYKKEEAEAFQNLSLVADMKKARLMRWMKERISDASVLAENNLTIKCVATVLPIVNEKVTSGIKGEALHAELQKINAYKTLTQQLSLVNETYGVYTKPQSSIYKQTLLLYQPIIKSWAGRALCRILLGEFYKKAVMMK